MSSVSKIIADDQNQAPAQLRPEPAANSSSAAPSNATDFGIGGAFDLAA